MPVTTEAATVYRGGGRRWFSREAAIKAEANKLIRLHGRKDGRCECDQGSYEWGEPGPTQCRYHDHNDPFRQRMYRRVVRLLTKDSQS